MEVGHEVVHIIAKFRVLVLCCRGHKVPHCIVVRHLSISQDLVHGDDDTYRQIGKRPSRRLEVYRLDHFDCLEHKGDMSSFHNFTGDAKETFELVL